MGSRAQISAEFFVLLGLAFLVAIAFEIASLEQLNDVRAQAESDAVKDLALKLQRELLTASSVEDGYVRTFIIPEKLDSINFSIKTQNSTIIVQSRNSFYMVPIPKSIGNVTKSTNKINKTNGIIYIN